MERLEVELGHVPWILDNDDVSPGERFIIEQVFEVLGLEIDLFNGFITKHISSCLDDSNVSKVVNHNTQSHKITALAFIGSSGLQLG